MYINSFMKSMNCQHEDVSWNTGTNVSGVIPCSYGKDHVVDEVTKLICTQGWHLTLREIPRPKSIQMKTGTIHIL